ncbi:hypothetical protein SLS53_006844 [Cytospora paraplurivora]|uniref:Uncharacterized protein n=1 Tax=Cytospora paraplurivora TaxID=2898453 RepID=A0AAN9U3T8_9PEZI
MTVFDAKFRSFSEDQKKAIKRLQKLPFGCLVIEGIPAEIQKLAIDDNPPPSAELPIEDPKIRCLLRHVQHIFDIDVQELRGKLADSDNKQAFDFKWHKHWRQWKTEAIRSIQQDLDTAVVITKDELLAENADAEDNQDSTVEDHEHELDLSADNKPSIPQLHCYPEVMIMPIKTSMVTT